MYLNKVFKNAGILASGDFIAAVLGFISFGIIGRSLGVEGLGSFSVIVTYVTLVDKFVNFQSWQALIKYCSKLKVDNKDYNSIQLLSFGLLIDIISALLAFFISITLCSYLADFFNWNNDYLNLIKLYSIVILFNIEGTPTAIFRIRNKFWYFSEKAVIISIIKLILFAFVWLFSSEISNYLYATMLAQMIGYSYFLFNSFKYVSLTPFRYFIKDNVKLILSKNPNFLSFIFTTNIQTSLKLTTSLVDTLIVSKFIGNSAVGVLQVTKQFSKIFTQVSSPLYKSIYPELASLWELNKIVEFKNLIKKSIKYATILSFSIYFLFALFGKYIITSYVGFEFINSYYLMLIYFVGIVIQVSTFPISPAFLAMGLPKIPLKTTLVSSLTFLVCFYFIYEIFGYLAIGVSFAIMTIVWLLQNSIIFYYKMKNL